MYDARVKVAQWPNEYKMIPAGLLTNRLKLFCAGPTGGVDSKLVDVVPPRVPLA